MNAGPRSPILLDTNVLSELARPHPAPDVVAARHDVSALGAAISVNDAYIAATAVTHGAILYPRNLKDVDQYPGLALHSPWGE